MKKAIPFALILTLVLSLCTGALAAPVKASPQDAETQLNLIFSNFNSLKQDDTNGKWSYTITDLDHNGRLEMIAASIQGQGRTTTAKAWEVNTDFQSFIGCNIATGDGGSFPDVISENADTYYQSATDTWYYLFSDSQVVSASQIVTGKCSISMKNDNISYNVYALQQTENVNGLTISTYTDLNGAIITPEQYNSAGADAFIGMDKSSTNFDWFLASEVTALSRLTDSYLIFAGDKQPGKPFTPAPVYPAASPTPQIVPGPSYLMITKNPTNETRNIGDTAWFVADASSWNSLSWTFVAPSGGEYSWQNFSYIFPYASVGGTNGTTLSISNVTVDMSGWGVYCTFYGNGQTARSNTAYLYVLVNPQPTPTPVPPQPTGGDIGGTLTDYSPYTVTIYLDNGQTVQVSTDICQIDGEYYVGAACDAYYSGYGPSSASIYLVYIYGSQPPEPTYGSMGGTIRDPMMSTVTIDLDNGDQVQVLRDICTMIYGSLSDGCPCTVYYSGGSYPTRDTIYHVDIYGLLYDDNDDDNDNDNDDYYIDNPVIWDGGSDADGLLLGAGNG